jgi:hypothetical protein
LVYDTKLQMYRLHTHANWLELMSSTLKAVINMSASKGVVLGEHVGLTIGKLDNYHL